MRRYHQFLRKNIDLAALGVERRGRGEGYSCIPKGARIIGWAGAGGSCYCFLRGYGEMVFAVSLLDEPGKAYPLAWNFTAFLRLLLACADVAALERAHTWEQGAFEAYLRDHPASAGQLEALEAIQLKLGLTPMEQPFAYVQELHAAFAQNRLDGAGEDAAGRSGDPEQLEWKVYFEGGFWGKHGKSKRGNKIPVGKQFAYCGRSWQVPAVYACGKGLVIDFCIQVPAAHVRAFMEKWNLSEETEEINVSPEQQFQMERDNPLAFSFQSKAIDNGRELVSSLGCGVSWNPCLPDGNHQAARRVLAYYHLDPAQGWVLWRLSYPWTTKRKPRLTKLKVKLLPKRTAIAGPRFTVAGPGEEISFTHPITGVRHRLTVLEQKRQQIDARCLGGGEWPTHTVQLCYALEPALPDGAFTVTDCAPCDQPRLISKDSPFASQADSDAHVCIIGGSYGPTAVYLSGGGGQGMACSALRFEPAEQIQWQATFYQRPAGECTVTLLGPD